MTRNVSLEAVPGIGEVRATALRNAGYTNAREVATASLQELQAVDRINREWAACLRETSRNACGFQETFAVSLAEEVNATPEEVIDAYAELAPAGITPQEAEDTLRRLFSDPATNSVLRFDEYSPKYRHFLFQAGFESMCDVVEADISELSKVKYIGRRNGKQIRQTAAEYLDALSEEDTDTDTSAIVWHYVCVTDVSAVTWNDTAHVIAHRRYNPDVWDQEAESHEIIRYAKRDEERLKGKFRWEVEVVYETAIAADWINPTYVTVMPSHDGDIASPLASLAQGLANAFGLTYEEVLSRSSEGDQQKYLSATDRWQNQDDSLHATRDVSGESVVVVDDISTSGASFATATHRLHQRGANVVICLALGLTTNQRQPVTYVDDSATTISSVADEL